MAANIKTLIRLAEWNVDEKRRKLAELQMLQDDLLGQRDRLDQEMQAEKAAATEDPVLAGMHYAAYAKQALERRENLERSIEQMAMVIEHAREELAEAFREQKKYENLQKNRDQRQRREEDRREQVRLDEVAQTQHRRKKA